MRVKEYRLMLDCKLYNLLENISELTRIKIADEYTFATTAITNAIRVAQHQQQQEDQDFFDWVASDRLLHTVRGDHSRSGNPRTIILKDKEVIFIENFQTEAEEYYSGRSRITFSFLIQHLLANYVLALKAQIFESARSASPTVDCDNMSGPETSAALTRLLLKDREDNDNAVLKQIQTLLIRWENGLSDSQESPTADSET